MWKIRGMRIEIVTSRASRMHDVLLGVLGFDNDSGLLTFTSRNRASPKPVEWCLNSQSKCLSAI